ncbi:MAG: DUF3052 domain-containing protein, partial [Chloroflexota bacterium]
MPEASGTGYSGTPLSKKLGIKAGHTVLAVNAPENYKGLLEPLPEDVRLLDGGADAGPVDMAHVFTMQADDLQRQLSELKNAIRKDGAIWVSWPKKASGVPSDLDGNVVRDVALQSGLVDVKVCAVDATWSG